MTRKARAEKKRGITFLRNGWTDVWEAQVGSLLLWYWYEDRKWFWEIRDANRPGDPTRGTACCQHAAKDAMFSLTGVTP